MALLNFNWLAGSNLLLSFSLFLLIELRRLNIPVYFSPSLIMRSISSFDKRPLSLVIASVSLVAGDTT
ncbi:hypothetical protein M405DRAFT_869516 [Rhizopogon salebrosus TDB-379]|nr:hypothetical protein M405DRAFT_869516 [Rhizopogon salebrosus TDB-379]